MAALNEDILERTRANDDFRRVVETGPNSQVVLMSVAAGSEIGSEVHEHIDQTLVIVSGSGAADLDDDTSPVGQGHLVFVPAGTRHNIRNTGDEPLKLYTVYAPPEHEPGTVHATKAEADAAHHDH